MNEVSRSLTANRNMGEFSNYGEKLYMEEKIRREKREKELELIKKMREEEELKNLTFQPNIRFLFFMVKFIYFLVKLQKIFIEEMYLIECKKLFLKKKKRV